MPLDADTFRTVMSKFATGVTIVTARAGEEIHGLTVNAFCSVSLEPMLVLICVDQQAKGHDLLLKSNNFAVNFLGADQEQLARRFSADQLSAAERFRDLKFRSQVTGAPLLGNSLAFLDCEIVAIYPGGDHTIFLGKVLALEEKDGHHPLLFFEGEYFHHLQK